MGIGIRQFSPVRAHPPQPEKRRFESLCRTPVHLCFLLSVYHISFSEYSQNENFTSASSSLSEGGIGASAPSAKRIFLQTKDTLNLFKVSFLAQKEGFAPLFGSGWRGSDVPLARHSLPPRSNPSSRQVSLITKDTLNLFKVSFLAQKEGFEPSRRFTQPTPLAGEPLRPLGYFCKTYML